MLKSWVLTALALTLIAAAMIVAPRAYMLGHMPGNVGQTIQDLSMRRAAPGTPAGVLADVQAVKLARGTYQLTIMTPEVTGPGSTWDVRSSPDGRVLARGEFVPDTGITKAPLVLDHRQTLNVRLLFGGMGSFSGSYVKITRSVSIWDALFLAGFALTALGAAFLLAKMPLAARLGVSFVFFSALILLNPDPTGSIGGTDHYSHLNSTLLFQQVGLDIYKKSGDQNCLEAPALCDEICADTPAPCISWSAFPRAYPPGIFLLHAPWAALKHFGLLTGLSARSALVVFYLLGVHVFFYVMFNKKRTNAETTPLLRDVSRYFIYPLVFLGSLQWAMSGFYDMFSVLFVCLCLDSLWNKRPVRSLLFYALAVFLHFRALWYFPVVLPALGALFTQARSQGLGRIFNRRSTTGLIAAGALFAGAGTAFILLWPRLVHYPFQSRLGLSEVMGCENYGVYFAFVLLMLLAAQAKAWKSLALMGSVGLFLVQSNQLMPWHTMFLYPLLLSPPADETQNDATAFAVIGFATLALVLISSVQLTTFFGGNLVRFVYEVFAGLV